MGRGFALVETALGAVGLVWTETGLSGLQLPDRDDAATLAVLRRRFPDAVPSDPPPAMGEVAAAIRALLAGESRDLSAMPLDLTGVPAFDRRVYAVALTIGRGETLTYGEVARRLGEPGATSRSGRRWAETRSRSRCPATASWRLAARSAVSRPRADGTPSAGCSRSRP